MEGERENSDSTNTSGTSTPAVAPGMSALAKRFDYLLKLEEKTKKEKAELAKLKEKKEAELEGIRREKAELAKKLMDADGKT